ncbi:MAG: hypothetical protein K8R54_15695 [Bacteroidales bacterium]|nr:hypothetical protein [Bacteroidales bacterium]
MKKEITFDIGIRKIKDLAFSVNEDVEFKKETSIQINSGLQFNKSDDTIELLLNINFLTKESNIEFMNSRTSNIFYIPNLVQYENKTNPDMFNLPDAMLITIVSLSITHARALISRNAKGTKFEDIYLPIFNPADLTKNLFSKKSK